MSAQYVLPNVILSPKAFKEPEYTFSKEMKCRLEPDSSSERLRLVDNNTSKVLLQWDILT